MQSPVRVQGRGVNSSLDMFAIHLFVNESLAVKIRLIDANLTAASLMPSCFPSGVDGERRSDLTGMISLVLRSCCQKDPELSQR